MTDSPLNPTALEAARHRVRAAAKSGVTDIDTLVRCALEGAASALPKPPDSEPRCSFCSQPQSHHFQMADGICVLFPEHRRRPDSEGLVKELRDAANDEDAIKDMGGIINHTEMLRTAADAIEALQAQLTANIHEVSRLASAGNEVTAKLIAAEARIQTIRAETKEEALKMIAPWKNQAELRLRVGEMTAQEKRTAVAIITAIEASIRALPDQASGGTT